MGRTWSIGLWKGASPLALRPAAGVPDPLLTAGQVTDVAGSFVADPFLLRRGGVDHLFFELYDGSARRGMIGLAVEEGGEWRYRGVVLEEPFHLSYPYVFEHRGECYMVPETLKAEAVCLYRARSFPDRWERVAELIPGRFADPSPCRLGGRWWLFACSPPDRHDTLRLFFAEELAGPWAEHPASPLVAEDPRRARPAGRLLTFDGRLLRFAQDCEPSYGTAVRAFEVLELSPTAYRERELGVVLTGGGADWNRGGMHHLDPRPDGPGRWIAAVDGWRPDGR